MTPWLFPRSRRCQSGTRVAFSMFGFAHLVTVPSLNVALFFPLSFSAAAEIRIQLLSEPPLTEFRVLDMGLSPCPSSLSINPLDGRDPGGQIVKLKEEAKHSSLCRDGSHLAPTSAPVDVASECVPILSLTLPGVLSHQPC